MAGLMRVKESWNRMPVWAVQQENWADGLLHCWCSYVWSSVPFIFPNSTLRGPEGENVVSAVFLPETMLLRSTLCSQLLVSRFKRLKCRNVAPLQKYLRNCGLFVNLNLSWGVSALLPFCLQLFWFHWKVNILTGVNLHLARGTAEQETGSILSDVRVGGWRLRVASTNAETHLGNQRTSPTAVTREGRETRARGSCIFWRLQ